MIKFKKALTIRVAKFLIVAIFLFSGPAYSIPIKIHDNIRVPIGSSEIKERLNDAGEKLIEVHDGYVLSSAAREKRLSDTTLLKKPSPLVLIGGEEELLFIEGMADYQYVKSDEMMRAIVPYAFNGGNSAMLQEYVRQIWKHRRFSFVRAMDWLNLKIPAFHRFVKEFYRRNGVEIVETIPSPGAFMYGFGAGHNRRKMIDRILLYRSNKEAHLAKDVIDQAREEVKKRIANFDQKPELQLLFKELYRYAEVVDTRLVEEWGLDLSGAYMDITKTVRPASVQNILFLGVMLEASKPGRIYVKKYYQALDRLAQILQAPCIPIHSSLESHYEATPVGYLEKAEMLTMPNGSEVMTDCIVGQYNLKVVRHKSLLKKIEVVNPVTLKPVSPSTTPEAVNSIIEAEQLIIMPENLQADLAVLLSSKENAEAFVERKKGGQITNLVIPVSTKDGTPVIIDKNLDDSIRRGTGYGITDIVSHVIINDLDQEPDLEVKNEAERILKRDNAQIVSVDPNYAKILNANNIKVIQCSLAEIMPKSSEGLGISEPQLTYQISANRLSFLTKLQQVMHRYKVAPILVTDIDGSIKPSGPTALPGKETEEIAKTLIAEAPICLLTGNALNTTQRITTDRVMGKLAELGQLQKMRLMPLQAVAGSLTAVFNPRSGKYEYVAGYKLEDVLRIEKFEKIKRIFNELTQKFNIGERNKKLGFKGSDNNGFWGDYYDDRIAGVTFAVIGKDAPQEAIDRYRDLGGKNLNREYLEYLIQRCKDEDIPLKWNLGSEFQIDGTLEWIDKGDGLKTMSKLTGITIKAMGFGGDNIEWTEEGLPGNDTKAAQIAGFSLNLSGSHLKENIEGKTVISASRKGGEGGSIPYLMIYREFYEKWVPNELKDFQGRLERGVEAEKEQQKKNTIEWANSQIVNFVAPGKASTFSKKELELILEYIKTLIDKGNNDDRLLAYQALKKIIGLESGLLNSISKEAVRLLKEYSLVANQEEYEGYLKKYQNGEIGTENNIDQDTKIYPVESIPLLDSKISSEASKIGAKSLNSGQVGYQILIGGQENVDFNILRRHFQYYKQVEKETNKSARVVIVTTYLNHGKVVKYLKANKYFGLDADQVDIEPQGLLQSIGVNTKKPYEFWTQGNNGEGDSRHLATPGTMDAFFTSLASRTFQKWLKEGVRHVIVSDLNQDFKSSADMLEHDKILLGAHIKQNSEMTASVIQSQEVTKTSGAPYLYYDEDNKKMILKESYAVSEDVPRHLKHVFRDVVSIEALVNHYIGVSKEEMENIPQSNLLDKIRKFIKDLRENPYVVRKKVYEGRIQQEVKIDQFKYPYSLLTTKLRTSYLNMDTLPSNVASKLNIRGLFSGI